MHTVHTTVHVLFVLLRYFVLKIIMYMQEDIPSFISTILCTSRIYNNAQV